MNSQTAAPNLHIAAKYPKTGFAVLSYLTYLEVMMKWRRMSAKDGVTMRTKKDYGRPAFLFLVKSSLMRDISSEK